MDSALFLLVPALLMGVSGLVLGVRAEVRAVREERALRASIGPIGEVVFRSDGRTVLSDGNEQLVQKHFMVSEASPEICFDVRLEGWVLRALRLDEVPEGAQFLKLDRDGVRFVPHVHGPKVAAT